MSSKRLSPNFWGIDFLLHSDHIAQTLNQYPGPSSCWIALSGGRDSCVLLDLCIPLRSIYPNLIFKAVHVHHGLQQIADQWVAHCQRVCNQHRIPLTVLYVNARGNKGDSPEEAARNARYQAFKDLILEGDLLMMAHHQEDQAETFLLQLLRGAGLEGISGMPDMAPLGRGFLLRPLLNIELGDIIEYALRKKLSWIDDPSNQDPKFDRNFLRHEVMPLLKSRWPATSRTLTRSVRHLSASAAYQKRKQQFLSKKIAPNGHFNLGSAAYLDDHELDLAIRGWFNDLKLRMPSEQKIKTFIKTFITSASDRSPVLDLEDGSCLRRYKNIAYHTDNRVLPIACRWIAWREPLKLPEMNGWLEMIHREDVGVCKTIWDQDKVQVQYRRGGEKIRLDGRNGHHELRDLFQSHEIPPWVRPHIPLIYLGDTLACVGDFWPNADVLDTETWRKSPKPRWTPPKDLDPTGALSRLQLRGSGNASHFEGESPFTPD